jgi:hypothetical protein
MIYARLYVVAGFQGEWEADVGHAYGIRKYCAMFWGHYISAVANLSNVRESCIKSGYFSAFIEMLGQCQHNCHDHVIVWGMVHVVVDQTMYSCLAIFRRISHASRLGVRLLPECLLTVNTKEYLWNGWDRGVCFIQDCANVVLWSLSTRYMIQKCVVKAQSCTPHLNSFW